MLSHTKQVAFITVFTTLFTGSVFATDAVDTHHFSPYLDLTLCNTFMPNNDPVDLVTASRESGVSDYHLAFINDEGSCVPAWGGQSSYSVSEGWASHLTDGLHARNIHYTISFGGEGGKDLSQACSETQLVAAYEQIIKTYQPEGLDFDIENDTPNISKIVGALKKIKTTHPTLKYSFTLPVLPDGLTEDGKNIVRQAKAAHLDYVVNIMTMDYGTDCTGDMAQYTIKSAKNTFLFLKSLYPERTNAAVWQMIAVTPLIGVNDTCKEKFTLADIDALRKFEKMNKFAYLSMWSFSRDMPCPSHACLPTCSGENLQSVPYEFSRHFLQK